MKVGGVERVGGGGRSAWEEPPGWVIHSGCVKGSRRGASLTVRLVVWLGDRRYSGRPCTIVRQWRAESFVTQADTLAQYFAEVHDWTMRLTGKEMGAPGTCRELIEELKEAGVVRIERESRGQRPGSARQPARRAP